MNKQVYESIEEVIYSKKLANGLSVILLPRKEMSKTYGLFTTDYGSIDQTFIPLGEDEAITVPDGVAHFLEHKLFEKEDRDVFADFGKQGASPNAYTSFTKTAYLFSATSNIKENVETLLDFVQDPYFSEESVEKEKGIIAQEIKMYDDQTDWQAFMGTVQAMFKNHPVNIDIAGTVDSIYIITKDDLYTCYNTFYHPENMLLFLAGNFEAEEMMDQIEKNQEEKEFEEQDEIKRTFPLESKEVAHAQKNIIMPVSMPKCTVGIKESVSELTGTAFLKRELMQEMILDHFFSTGGSFYHSLYDDKLINDSFQFSTTLEKNFGYTLIGTNTNHPEEFSVKVKELLLRTNNEKITNEELEIMKKKKIGRILRAMNSLEYIANQYTRYHLLEIDFFTMIPAIQSLSLEEVNAFLKDWISEEYLSVCTISAEE